MKIRKDLVIAVLVTFCLTTTLFMIRASWSGGEWDPWVDIKEDGTVDIYDAITLANAYGTSGDTTKNVSVTNWPVRRTLNASLADNLLIDSYQIWYFTADIEGYNRITLVIRIDYVEGSPVLSANIRFIIGGVHTPKIYSNNTLTVGTYFLLQSYEVIGPTIEIELDPSGGPQRVSLGIYATD